MWHELSQQLGVNDANGGVLVAPIALAASAAPTADDHRFERYVRYETVAALMKANDLHMQEALLLVLSSFPAHGTVRLVIPQAHYDTVRAALSAPPFDVIEAQRVGRYWGLRLGVASP